MSFFKGISVLVIPPSPLEDKSALDKLVETLKKNEASVLVKSELEGNTNYLENDDSSNITHIIATSPHFSEYSLARSYMIPVTTPEWVWESMKAKKMLNPKTFNPNPRYFMRDVFLCIADSVAENDKNAIYEAVKCFGGQCLDDLTKYTTHLIAHDLTNEKSLIALSASNGSSQQDKIDIKIVSPQWIHDCLSRGEKIDSKSYTLTGGSIEQNEINGNNGSHTQGSYDGRDPLFPSDEPVFDRKSFFIASDCKLSDNFVASIKSLIQKNGGSISTEFNPNAVDVYLGKYREGPEFKRISSSNAVVGNLPWLYSVIVSNRWISPLKSNMLHYPIPSNHLNEFKGLKISVTNYSGDARAYLADLIEVLGGTFTKTLTKENDFLIAARPEGKKYEAAITKWSYESGNGKVNIVNHTWLEECYNSWKLLDPSQRRFVVSERSIPHLGSTYLYKALLAMWYTAESDVMEIDDSEDSGHSDNPFFGSNNEKENDEVHSTKDKHDTISSIQEPKQRKESLSDLPNDASPVNVVTPQRGGRSAAKKAAMKLHNSISDLNNYKEIMKSSRKMKSYMEELDSSVSVTPKRKNIDDDNDTSKEMDRPSSAKKAKSETPETKYHVFAVMTGCESEVKLGRSDLSKLAAVGIKIVSDSGNIADINTLIAPKILRTEKFLTSLAFVDHIIHPNYLIDILKKANLTDFDWNQISKEFKITDYSLEKVLPRNEINNELGVSSKRGNGLNSLLQSDKKGVVFEGLKFNLSVNLNGGVEVVSRILGGHGAEEIKSVKTINSKASTKNLLTYDGDNVILVAHKTKDAKLIQNFKKFIPNGNVVEWDWCVKSIFKMQLENFNDYKL